MQRGKFLRCLIACSLVLICGCPNQGTPGNQPQTRIRLTIPNSYLNTMPSNCRDQNGDAKVWIELVCTYANSGGVGHASRVTAKLSRTDYASVNSSHLYSSLLVNIPVNSSCVATLMNCDPDTLPLSSRYIYTGPREPFIYNGSGNIDYGW